MKSNKKIKYNLRYCRLITLNNSIFCFQGNLHTYNS